MSHPQPLRLTLPSLPLALGSLSSRPHKRPHKRARPPPHPPDGPRIGGAACRAAPPGCPRGGRRQLAASYGRISARPRHQYPSSPRCPHPPALLARPRPPARPPKQAFRAHDSPPPLPHACSAAAADAAERGLRRDGPTRRIRGRRCAGVLAELCVSRSRSRDATDGGGACRARRWPPPGAVAISAAPSARSAAGGLRRSSGPTPARAPPASARAGGGARWTPAVALTLGMVAGGPGAGDA
jgi:hypothetical protein